MLRWAIQYSRTYLNLNQERELDQKLGDKQSHLECRGRTISDTVLTKQIFSQVVKRKACDKAVFSYCPTFITGKKICEIHPCQADGTSHFHLNEDSTFICVGDSLAKCLLSPDFSHIDFVLFVFISTEADIDYPSWFTSLLILLCHRVQVCCPTLSISSCHLFYHRERPCLTAL